MVKSSLRDGMKVKLRNGDFKFVFVSRGVLISTGEEEYGKYIDLEPYNKDLTHPLSSGDIIEVYDVCDKLIWRRDETDWTKITFGSKVVCSREGGPEFEGRFLDYYPNTQYPFAVFVKEASKALRWSLCRLIDDCDVVSSHDIVTEEEFEREFNIYCDNVSCCPECNYHRAGDLEFKTKCRTRFLMDKFNVYRK